MTKQILSEPEKFLRKLIQETKDQIVLAIELNDMESYRKLTAVLIKLEKTE